MLGLRKQAANVRLASHIRLNGNGFATMRGDVLHYLPCGFRPVIIIDHDCIAFLRQAAGAGGTDAARTSSNNSHSLLLHTLKSHYVLRMKPDYHSLVSFYTDCFIRHGTNHKGVDWPKEQDALARHSVMLDLLAADSGEKPTLLDLGCGYGALKDTMDAKGLHADYRGIELSEPMLQSARKRHPTLSWEVRDVLQQPLPERSVDFVVMNGVLTEKRELSFEAMESFAQAMIRAAFSACRVGIAFNVMSEHVDWKRDDLFHLGFDRLAAFLKSEVSRNFVFRADYGLYEYTTYVYREQYPFSPESGGR